jgi:rhodanese-related sulfurtransferase
MTTTLSKLLPVTLLALTVATPLQAEESPALEEIQAYLDFATYSDGTISLEQLKDTGGQEILFIDTRSGDQFAESHIPDAIHIEWRELLSRRDEVPNDKPVVLYCNTGTLSAKAQFILRLAGQENVKVLHGGFDAWKREQAGASQ